jgi:hypothetical protein
MWWRWLLQRRTWWWLAIALLVRGAYFWLFLHEHGLHSAWYGWGAENGDTPGYFEPIDSYLAGNAYRPDFRTPGYGIPYLLFRIYTTPQGAGTGILFLQFLLSVASVVVLTRSAGLLGASQRLQDITCVAFALFGRVAVYDVHWFTESFCVSAMIFGVHGWLAGLRSGHWSAFLWSGAWMGWAVFLRPVQALWLMLMAAGLLLMVNGFLRQKLSLLALFLLPFMCIDGLWIRRNWIMHHEVSPLSRGTVMPELAGSQMYPVMRFMQAIGGNYIHWDPSATIRWFNMREGPHGAQGKRMDRNVRMPEYALSASLTADSLHVLADEMARFSDPALDEAVRRQLLGTITQRCDRYISRYRSERPWQYHLMAPCRLTGLFFHRAGLAGLFADPPRSPGWWVTPLEILDKLMHWLVLIGGLFAAGRWIAHWRSDHLRAWLAALTVVGVTVFPWVLRLCEGRYLVPMYPWLLLLCILALAPATVHRRSPE